MRTKKELEDRILELERKFHMICEYLGVEENWVEVEKRHIVSEKRLVANKNTADNLPERIEKYLKSNSLTKAELAGKVGVHVSSISRWLEGGGINQRNLRKINKIL